MDPIQMKIKEFLAQPHVQSAIQSAEVERKKIVRHGGWVLGAVFIVFGLLTFLLWQGDNLLSPDELSAVGRIAIIAVAGVLWKVGRDAAKANNLHNEVLTVLARQIDSGLTYTHAVTQYPIWVTNRTIIPEHDSLKVSDCLAYTSNHTAHGLHFLVQTTGYKLKATQQQGKSTKIVLNAFVTEFTFEKPRYIASTAILVKGETPSFFSDLFSHRHAVHLESNEFEKHFDVSCADQTLARTILNPYVMETIMRFTIASPIPRQCDFLFIENKLYVIQHTGGQKDVFDMAGFSALQPYSNPAFYENFYKTFLSFQSLLRDLELYYYDYGSAEKQGG